jgi:pimeloyl-ACP methyl ester carboxylesterase
MSPSNGEAAAVPLGRLDGLLLGAGARLDRFVLDRYLRRHAFALPRDAQALRARLERARAFYADPRLVEEPDRFFTPPAPLRVQVRRLRTLRGGAVVDLAYESAFVPVFPEVRHELTPDRRGLARWWRHDAPGHPAMLCIHGYGGGFLWLERLAFAADRFYRAGLDVVIAVLPFHGRRRPPGMRRSGAAFFDVDLTRTNEAFAQTIYELRALLRHLLASGTGPVGAFGMSLGGYLTALLASVEPELAFAVPMIPLASLADMIWATGAGDARLAAAVEHGWTPGALEELSRVHTPLARPPLVPHDRRLIIAALGARICPPAHAERLWRHWDRPRIHWYPGGHLAQFRRGAALAAIRALLRDARVLPTRERLPRRGRGQG